MVGQLLELAETVWVMLFFSEQLSSIAMPAFNALSGILGLTFRRCWYIVFSTPTNVECLNGDAVFIPWKI